MNEPRQMCDGCGRMVPPKFLRGGMCGECRGVIHEERKARQDKEDKVKALADIRKQRRSLVELMNNAPSKKDDVASFASFVNVAMQRLGGEEGLADIYVQEFRRVRGEGLSEEEKLKWRHKPEVVHKYLSLMVNSLRAENESGPPEIDFSDMSEEDLQVLLMPVAVQAIRDNPMFRRELARFMVRSDPAFVQMLLSEVGGLSESGDG